MWNLDLGIWPSRMMDLECGTWNEGFWTWDMGLWISYLEFGMSELGFAMIYLGIWGLGFGT